MSAGSSPTHTTPPPQPPVMVTIPAGPFLMGTDPREVRQLGRTAHGNRMEWYAREQPLHTLTLSAYQIGRYPVTVGEYAVFIESGGYLNSTFWGEDGWRWREQNRNTQPEYWLDPDWSSDPNLPVAGVSWHAATAYCHWLSHATGSTYRLPTEPEWEKAARGEDGRRYPWGNRWEPTYANTAPETIDSWDAPDPNPRQACPTPVGQFSPIGDSPFGCADMAGNLWEWCDSPLRRYPLSLDQPANPRAAMEPQIVRGGSWYHGPDDARCAARYCYYPHGQDNVVGFRLAADL